MLKFIHTHRNEILRTVVMSDFSEYSAANMLFGDDIEQILVMAVGFFCVCVGFIHGILLQLFKTNLERFTIQCMTFT